MSAGGWDQWASRVVSEVDDAAWQNPREAVAEALAKAGAEIASHTRNIAAGDALASTAAYSSALSQVAALDAQFEQAYPDLMGSPVKRMAVESAVRQLMSDSRFMRGVANPQTRKRAFEVVAKMATRELGLPASAPRRPVDAPHGPASPDPWDVDRHRQQEAQRELLDYATLNNRRGG